MVLQVSNKTLTFAPVKQNVLTYRQNRGQKRANFSASFNACSLVVSDIFATLHTHNVRTYCSVRLFHFLLRAREAGATPISKGLFGVTFASFFVPMGQGVEREITSIFHLLNIRDL